MTEVEAFIIKKKNSLKMFEFSSYLVTADLLGSF